MITKTITITTYQKNRVQGFCYNIGWNNNLATSPEIGDLYYFLLIATCYKLDATYQKNNNSNMLHG